MIRLALILILCVGSAQAETQEEMIERLAQQLRDWSANMPETVEQQIETKIREFRQTAGARKE